MFIIFASMFPTLSLPPLRVVKSSRSPATVGEDCIELEPRGWSRVDSLTGCQLGACSLLLVAVRGQLTQILTHTPTKTEDHETLN